MVASKQHAASTRIIKKAATAAKRARTIAHLPERTRTALDRQGSEGSSSATQRGWRTLLESLRLI